MVWYTIDTETIGLDSSKYITGCLLKEDGTYWISRERKALWNKLLTEIENNEKQQLRTYIYAHNHDYDFNTYARGEIINNNDIHIINTETFIIKIRENTWLLDTYPFYKMSLEKAGELIGEKKRAHPTAFGKEPNNEKEWEELNTYCLQDCKVAMEMMQTIKRELNKLGFKPRKIMTPGQTAMTCFQIAYKHSKEPWNHIYTMEGNKRTVTKTNHDKKIRKAYRGGIVNAYHLGHYTNVTYADKRSLYPYIMSTMRFPNLKTEELITEPTKKGYTQKEILNKIGVSRVTIRTPTTPFFPLLPVRQGEENIYPEHHCTITANYTHEELTYALTLGYKITNIHWSIIYDDGHNPFTNYIQRLYEQRKKAPTKAAAHVIKLLMNSLSGKFAQCSKNKDIRIIPRATAETYLQQGYTIKGHSDIYYYLEKELGEYTPSYAHVIISALITAGGRCYIHDKLNKIPRQDLYYCDTDGIFARDGSLNFLDYNDNLDGWAKNNEGKELYVKGKKSKLYAGELSVSGIKRTEITPEEYLTKETIEIQRLIGITEAAKAGDILLAGTPITKTFSLKERTEEEPQKKYEEPEE